MLSQEADLCGAHMEPHSQLGQMEGGNIYLLVPSMFCVALVCPMEFDLSYLPCSLEAPVRGAGDLVYMVGWTPGSEPAGASSMRWHDGIHEEARL